MSYILKNGAMVPTIHKPIISAFAWIIILNITDLQNQQWNNFMA